MNINEIMRVEQELIKDFFYDYVLDEVYERNTCEYHAMTGEHTEVLGQFMDKTAMNVEDLKECLIFEYISRMIAKRVNKGDE